MSEEQKLSYISNGDEALSIRVYNVGREQCKPLHQWGPGIRNFYLIHHVVSGKGIYKVGKRSFEINAGNTFLIYPNTEITYIADQNDPWEYYWVGFQGNDARIIINQTDFTEENPVIYADIDNNFEAYLMNIYNSKGNGDSAKINMLGYLMLALSLLVEKASHTKRHYNSTTTYLQKATEYIEYNYTQELTVQGIADYIGISRSQLFRVFKEHYNKSPEQFILEFRIRQACQLLKTSQLSIGSVAYSVGFNDNLYFSKAFKKIKGMSPRDYMHRIAEKSI
ncbi:MAG: transcriptional regulator, AraC family [Herbinix sp.]|jgi:AraC-like DNA-binding protein|nr:transcriptional regulator, AraC family [Herbinix sp.]